MLLFTVANEGGPMPWVVRHVPTGMGAGAFAYRTNAIGAARAMHAVGETHDITTAEAATNNATIRALLAARRTWTEADAARAAARAIGAGTRGDPR